VTAEMQHSLDALGRAGGRQARRRVSARSMAWRGDKQDNMIESPDFVDPALGIPVHSLYGKVRRPAAAMMQGFDVLLVDLQDLGCRIYTFITTLALCPRGSGGARQGGMDPRPSNPAAVPSRPAAARGLGELRRRGALADAPRPHHWASLRVVRADIEARHRVRGRHDGRLAAPPPARASAGRWAERRLGESESQRGQPLDGPRCYAGTVLLEGRRYPRDAARPGPWSSSARRTSSPGCCSEKMRSLAPHWMRGCRLRECWFEPTFQKHAGKLCAGLQIHVEDAAYDHDAFRPWRLMALAFKALRALRPDYELWRDFPYEYEHDRLAIDLINGGELLRNWWTILPRRRPTWTRWRAWMNWHGWKSARSYCCTLREIRDRPRFPCGCLRKAVVCP